MSKKYLFAPDNVFNVVRNEYDDRFYAVIVLRFKNGSAYCGLFFKVTKLPKAFYTNYYTWVKGLDNDTILEALRVYL